MCLLKAILLEWYATAYSLLRDMFLHTGVLVLRCCVHERCLGGFEHTLRQYPGPGYVATPIWDREEITSTVAQYKGTAYAASLESFGKGIIEAVRRGHTPERIARCV